MTGPNEPYDIDGSDKPAVPPGSTGSTGSSGATGDPAAKPRLFDIPLPPATGGTGSDDKPGKGKIDAPKLLEGFAEDADFDKDPELERAITGKDKKTKVAQPVADAMEDFVKPGLGSAKVWMVVGTVLLVAAMMTTGIYGEFPTWMRVLVLLYDTLLHTGTGVVALFIAATLLKKRLGNFELAAVRMFAAVSAFSLMLSMPLHVFGLQGLDLTLRLILAAASYGILVSTLFGLWKRETLGYVVGAHFGLWLIVAVGTLMAQYVAQHSNPAKATPPAHTVTK